MAAASVVAPVAPVPASLYVGDLDKDVSEAQLFDVFSTVGPVASIRVCRDAVTRRSLGYAYVNYNSALDDGAAERALEQLNYTKFNDKAIRIMWSHRDPNMRKTGQNNIFIKNLDPTIDNKTLHDTFAAFGNILSAKVAATPDAKSKGYGFVHFESTDAAQKAIETVSGMLLADRKVFVGPFVKKTERPSDKDAKFTNVFIKNVGVEMEEKALIELAQKYGEISSAKIMCDATGKSKGFGFVAFASVEAAAACVAELNGSEVNGKPVFVGRAQKKGERENELRAKFDAVREERMQKFSGMNLYVKNLADSVDDEALRGEFGAFGTITSAKVMRDEKGRSKGFAFVCYASPEEATRAVTEANGRMLAGKPLYVAIAQRKEIRRAQLEAAYSSRLALQNRAVPPMGGVYPPGAAPVMFAPQLPPGARPGMVPGYGPSPYGNRNGPFPRGQMPRGQMGNGYGPVPPNAYGVMPNGAGQQAGPRARQDPRQRGGKNAPTGGVAPGPVPKQPLGNGVAPGAVVNTNAVNGPQKGVPAPASQRPPLKSGYAGAAARPPPPAGSGPTASAPAAVVPGGADQAVTTATLASLPAEQQKQLLGERLYPGVQGINQELAGKVTGMLLEMDNAEILLLLESNEALGSKVNEAIMVLKSHAMA